MNATDLISVVVPVYNTSAYLPKCLDSLLKQTYSNIEIVVINDGSTDASPSICNEYAEKFPDKIKVYHTENRGLSAARNKGMKLAHGSYIGFVDSDDWCEPEMYQELYENVIEHNAEMSSCAPIEDFGKQTSIEKHRHSWCSSTTEELLGELLLNASVYGYAWNKLFKRASLLPLSFDEALTSCEDLDFCVRYALNLNSNKAVHSINPLYHYRQHASSMTGISGYSPRKLSVIAAYENILPIYEKHAAKHIARVRKNLLKIYINVLGRALISDVSDKALYKKLNEGIQAHWTMVLNDKSTSVLTKINIILSRQFPRLALRCKQLILKLCKS